MRVLYYVDLPYALIYVIDDGGLLQHGLPLPALPAASFRHLHRQVNTALTALTAEYSISYVFSQL